METVPEDPKKPLNREEFVHQMSHVNIPTEDLNTIYDIGLGMSMDPRDIFDFTKKSDIKERLASRQVPRERIRQNLMGALPYDEIASREAEVETSFKRFTIIMALREFLKQRALEAELSDLELKL
ncbi:hypothetical protein JW752_02525 [Candidatus Peregrinibacteria bacterium]|nr:hypothetical protein [Candidatus Peregrinibacteria bacterium]